MDLICVDSDACSLRFCCCFGIESTGRPDLYGEWVGGESASP